METVERLVSFIYVQVELRGGAPWGFTLKGGVEHGEPLIITKIEEGGKAAECRKLRVGDELVDINGSALCGSRQEALILIMGSYKILELVVRRRSVPALRPHSCHLPRHTEPSPAMQLHSGTVSSTLWHSAGDNSELSMQWTCSPDNSSSPGSMESLDQPNQGYYESQLSPVDPALLHSKRDSAYSSFSASSNISDCTVSLRPAEAGSVDNLLQGLSCYGNNNHSPSKVGNTQTAQPPGNSGKRSASAPVGIPSLSEGWEGSTGCSIEQYYTFSSRHGPYSPQLHRSPAHLMPATSQWEEPEQQGKSSEGAMRPRMRELNWSSTPGCSLDKETEASWREVEPQRWGRSLSMPGEADDATPSVMPPSLASAVSMDTLLEESHSQDLQPTKSRPPGPVCPQSRQRRRRSERFATSLRNEIQRKKAQLQSIGSGQCGDQAVDEEEEDEEEELKETHPFSNHCGNVHKARFPPPQVPPRPSSCSTQAEEESTSTGKPRRWRFTPQNKLQPEEESGRRGFGSTGQVSVPRSSRLDENDVPPFADRRRFFEESSRSLSVSNLPALLRPRQSCSPKDTPDPTRRRFSYQGSVQRPPEARRPSVSSCGDGQEEKFHPLVNSRAQPPRAPDPNPSVLNESPAPRSAFRPVSNNRVQDLQPHIIKHSQRSCTPTEAHAVRTREQTKLSRKYSLTERDFDCGRTDLQPVTGNEEKQETNHREKPRGSCRLSMSSEDRSVERFAQRSRALSENDIHPNVQCLDTRCEAFAGSVLREQDEASHTPRKKATPPPRPPPPKWEQYYRRRASHHAIYTLPRETASPTPTELSCSRSPPGIPCDQGETRPRSHSLPPRVEPESCRHCGFAPIRSPALSRRPFQPLAPTLWEPELPPGHPDPPMLTDRLRPLTQPYARQCSLTARGQAEQARPELLKPLSRLQPCGVQWERNAVREDHSPEAYLAVCPSPRQQSERHNSKSALEEPCLLETDIDDYQESSREDEEVLGHSCTTTVLETDIDALAEAFLPPLAEAQSRADLLKDLLPSSGEGEYSVETWRGSHRILTLSVDTLERRSRHEPAGSQSVFAVTAQSRYQSAELQQVWGGDDDRELNYNRQLMESLRRKLGVLREAQRGLQEEVRTNSRLGEQVEALVLAVCRPCEVDKFRMLVGDLDKVVSLLLSLSGRLLRVENELEQLGEDVGHHERLHLVEKKQQLLGQLSEARELKEHVDRREQVVCGVLSRCLTPEQLRDYSHFVKMKAALLVEQRQLEDKIRLGEEQLRGLRDSLGLDLGLGYSQH